METTHLPNIGFSSSPTGQIGDTATAVGFLTTSAGVTGLEKILLTNAGAGYVTPPTITISGGGGSGAAATCRLVTSGQGVVRFTVTDGGVGYGTAPVVTIAGPPSSGIAHTAVGIASIGRDGTSNVLKSIYIENAGRGYSSSPQVTIADPETLAGLGTYLFNEIVIGSRSGTYARVKEWDKDTNILKISNVGIGTTQTRFFPGESIVGQESGAAYPVQSYVMMTFMINIPRMMSLKLLEIIS